MGTFLFTEIAKNFGLIIYTVRVMYSFRQRMRYATFWAIFSQAHLVTLIPRYTRAKEGNKVDWSIMRMQSGRGFKMPLCLRGLRMSIIEHTIGNENAMCHATALAVFKPVSLSLKRITLTC
jgi:hypothetical protein